jgi:aspartate/methionine/tyrosine aminotransferase
MLEVCSTSLPQYAIPRVIGDDRYIEHLDRRKAMFGARSKEACQALANVEGIHLVPPQGAFYLSILFDDGVLNDGQSLDITDEKVRAFVADKVKDVEVDKRFVYYLLGATGICVVPLTGFCCKRKGFRVTLLECDDEKRKWTWQKIAESIKAYLASA